jgi:hypothetical protein
MVWRDTVALTSPTATLDAIRTLPSSQSNVSIVSTNIYRTLFDTNNI